MLNFDHLTHTYDVDGEEYPSVTTILKKMGFIDDRWFTKEARDRGIAVHEMTYGIDVGDFKLSDFADSEYLGYLEAWEKFKADMGVEIIEAEKMVFDEQWKIAGTLDRIMIVGGRVTLGDIKTGGHAFSHGLQLAAYHEMSGKVIDDRIVIHLKNDGKYSLGVEDKKIGSYNSSNWNSIWNTIKAAHFYRREYGS